MQQRNHIRARTTKHMPPYTIALCVLAIVCNPANAQVLGAVRNSMGSSGGSFNFPGTVRGPLQLQGFLIAGHSDQRAVIVTHQAMSREEVMLALMNKTTRPDTRSLYYVETTY
jgi:hypothetical protein